MTVYIADASIDDLKLTAGDEIGIFDADNCVGVGKVSGNISLESPLEIICSKDDEDSGINGFIEDHSITFKIWDSDLKQEIDNDKISASFINLNTNESITPKPFEGNGDCGVTLFANTLHYSKIWSGNPNDSMTLYIVDVSISNIEIESGDEIGIFDGNNCVGASRISGDISQESTLDIICSKDDDDSGINGFIEDNEITFRLWDTSEEREFQLTAKFLDTSTGTPIYPSPPFKGNGDYGVMLSGEVTHTISLINGWNIFSSYVSPNSDNSTMLSVVQPLIDSGCLIKVIDEKGKRLSKVFGQWKDSIEDGFSSYEGYKIKVSCDTNLLIKGTPVELPATIPLLGGWNIIGYPCSSSQEAITVMQPLINSEELIKVIDERGKRLSKVFGQWKDSIEGGFMPGEGYKLKVTTNTNLIISTPSNGGQRSLKRSYSKTLINGSHFSTIWSGNPNDSMMLYITDVSISNIEIESGDEIGIFDGNNCVGASRISGDISQESTLDIICSKDDDDSGISGFIEGHEIIFRFWDTSEKNEFQVTAEFISTDTGDPISPPPSFEGNGDYGVMLSELTHIISLGNTTAQSEELSITDTSFLQDDGDYLKFGHNTATCAEVQTDLTGTNLKSRLSREWYLDINDEDNNGGNIQLTFDFGENNTTAEASEYYLIYRTGSDSSFEKVTSGSNFITATYVTDHTVVFDNVNVNDLANGYYTLGSTYDRLPVTLLYFNGTALKGHILLEWETGSEVNCLGFNILRSESEGGEYTKITDEIIDSTGLSWGASYSYTDTTVIPGKNYFYQLEDIEEGTTTLHPMTSPGPIKAIAKIPEMKDTVLILKVLCGISADEPLKTDFNMNGKTDMGDLIYALQYLVENGQDGETVNGAITGGDTGAYNNQQNTDNIAMEIIEAIETTTEDSPLF
ncbi:hypothetical protein GMMP1_710002 [Candidatus Magnetomoraceae bacterium gMMP-1]